MANQKVLNPAIPIIAQILVELSKIADGFLLGIGAWLAFNLLG